MPLSTFTFQRVPQVQLLFRILYSIQFVSSGAELGKVGAQSGTSIGIDVLGFRSQPPKKQRDTASQPALRSRAAPNRRKETAYLLR